MANPKRRHSNARTSKRRAHDHLTNPSLGTCPNCGSIKAPHQVCGYCGSYRGVEVIKIEEEEKEKEKAS